MKGDFSRLTFRSERHYTAVLLQQGRPVMDADWNEEAEIASNAVRALARDLLGPHAGVGEGFSVTEHAGTRADGWDLLIAPGVYYVDGIRCENARSTSFRQMAEAAGCGDVVAGPGAYLAYLDVWERHLTAIQQPELLEPGLGDVSTRLQTVWRVRLLELDGSAHGSPEQVLADSFTRGIAGMRARVDPDAGYTGLENHLYRVEVHRGAGAGDPSFKWSRDNGSVVASVLEIDDDRLVLSSKPSPMAWQAGTWVEPEDEHGVLCERVPPLLRIEAVDGERIRTSPAWPLGTTRGGWRSVRRWDHGQAGDPDREGAIPIREDEWLALEDGIQIAFDPSGDYRAGDYWLIPARTADRSVGWPSDASSTGPATVEHHRRRWRGSRSIATEPSGSRRISVA